MEDLEIQSSRDLTTANPGPGARVTHSYQIDRHQFIAAYSKRQHAEPQSSDLFTLLTVASERIWMSDQECAQVASAIRSSRPTVTLN